MDEFHIKRALKDRAGLDAELLREIAEALGIAGERVEQALVMVEESAKRVADLRRRHSGASRDEEKARLANDLLEEITLYNALRVKAIEQYRWLIIHREAVGFRNHRLVTEQYRIPPAIKLAH